jgi:hypothetical protein
MLKNKLIQIIIVLLPGTAASDRSLESLGKAEEFFNNKVDYFDKINYLN